MSLQNLEGWWGGGDLSRVGHPRSDGEECLPDPERSPGPAVSGGHVASTPQGGRDALRGSESWRGLRSGIE